MANPDHIAWLLEGVEAWNARREKDDFKPDFEGADLRAAFEKAGLPPEKQLPLNRVNLRRAVLRKADLRAANLREAILREADLREADLREADLWEAVLRWADLRKAVLWKADLREAVLREAFLGEASLREAVLREADLRGAGLLRADMGEANLGTADLRNADFREAVLQGTDLRGAVLEKANVTTRAYSRAETTDGGAQEYTDLRKARNLTQAQLDIMRGDSGTILPDHLTRPSHWPELQESSPKDTPEDAQSGTPVSDYAVPGNGSHDTKHRARFLLQRARGAALTADTVAFHLETEAQFARQATNVLGPDIDLIEEMILTLRALSREVSDNSTSEADLETRIAELEAQVADLTDALEKAQPSGSEFSKAFVSSAGKTLGAAVVAAPLGVIVGGLSYLLGAGANATLIGFGTAAASAGLGAVK